MSRNNAAAAVLECRELELKLREMQQPSGHKGGNSSKSPSKNSSKSSSTPSSNPTTHSPPSRLNPPGPTRPVPGSSNASEQALPTGSMPGSDVSSRGSPIGDGGNVPTSNKTTSSPGPRPSRPRPDRPNKPDKPNQPPHQTSQLLHEVDLRVEAEPQAGLEVAGEGIEEGAGGEGLADLETDNSTNRCNQWTACISPLVHGVSHRCHECCQGCNRCCAGSVIGAVDLTGTLSLSKTAARIAGGMVGMAISFVSDCWLEHPPFIGDVLGAMGSLGGLVVLNSIEWEVIVNPNDHVHQQVIIAMLLCYGIIFLQGGIVIWHLVQAPNHSSHWTDECHEACCAASEGYYCLLVLSACSLLRFAVPLEGMNGQSYSHVNTTGSYFGKSGSIAVTVGAALLSVAAMLLQLFASFGRYGSNYAVLVLVPIVTFMPMLLITRVKADQSGQRFGVFTGWSCFIPSLLYVFSLLWPFALYHRHYLNGLQLGLSTGALVCLLIAARCLVSIVGQKVNTQASKKMTWQIGF